MEPQGGNTESRTTTKTKIADSRTGLGGFARAQRSVGVHDFEEWPGVVPDVKLPAFQHLIERIATAIMADSSRAKLQRLKIRAEAAKSATPGSLQEFRKNSRISARSNRGIALRITLDRERIVRSFGKIASNDSKAPDDWNRLFVPRIDPFSQRLQARGISLQLLVALPGTKRTPGVGNRAAEWRLKFVARLQPQPDQPCSEIRLQRAQRYLIGAMRTENRDSVRIDFVFEKFAQPPNFQGRKKLRLIGAAAV